MDVSWTFQRDGVDKVRQSSMRLYTFRQLRDLLATAGFEAIKGFDGVTEAPFGLGSSRLSMVGTRRP